MSTFNSKIEQIKKDLQKQYGDFILFSLVKLKITPKKWDIVVCADWLPKRQKEAIRFVVNELRKTLVEDDFLYISGVVILDKHEDFIKELQNLISTKQEKVYKNLVISNLSIKEIRILKLVDKNEEIINLLPLRYMSEIQIELYIEEQVRQRINKMACSSTQSSDNEYPQQSQLESNIIRLDDYRNKPQGLNDGKRESVG